jgi:hypothetical protein
MIYFEYDKIANNQNNCTISINTKYIDFGVLDDDTTLLIQNIINFINYYI